MNRPPDPRKTPTDIEPAPTSSKSSVRVVYLCSKDHYRTKMSRGRFQAVAALAEKCELRMTGNGWEDYDERKSVAENLVNHYEGQLPDAIIAYKPLEHRNLREVPCLKVIPYNEMWDVDGTTREIVTSGAELIIAHHRNDIEKYGHLRCVRFVNISHCADDSIYRDYRLPKELDLLLVGAQHDYHYPFRARLKALMESRLAKYLRCRVLQHPGYDLEHLQGVVLVDYARQVNRAKITLTCSSRWKYRLAKYVEIPMCASLLAADVPAEDNDYFGQFVLALDPAESDQQIIDKLVDHARNDAAREQLIAAGLDACREYTQRHYAMRLLEAIHYALESQDLRFRRRSSSNRGARRLRVTTEGGADVDTNRDDL